MRDRLLTDPTNSDETLVADGASSAGRTVAAATVAVTFAAIVLVVGDGSSITQSFNLVGFVSASAFACWQCAQRAQSSELDRSGWSWLAVACGMWCAGATAWAYYGITRDHQYPFPSVADVGFTAYAIPAAIGLWLMRPIGGGWPDHAWALLDVATIATAVLFSSWVTVLGPVLESSFGSVLETAASAAYPAADVVVVSMALAVGVRRASYGVSWILLGSGFTVLAVTDSVYTLRVLDGAYEGGHLLDLGWIVAFVIIGVGASLRSGQSANVDPPVARVRVGPELLPYLPVGLAVILAARADSISATSTPALFWLGAALLMLVSCRQIVILVERTHLLNNSEARVAARTRDIDDQRQQLSDVLDALDEGVIGCDAAGTITTTNAAMARMFGPRSASASPGRYSDQFRVSNERGDTVAARDLPLARALRGEVIRNTELTFTADGLRPRTMSTNSRPITTPSGTVTGAVMAVHDVTDRLRAIKEIERRAAHDDLTGLANRASFYLELEHHVARIDGEMSLLMLDIDEFKRVNDTFGHHAGDLLLIEVAARLSGCVRDLDIVCRLSGDEFCVFLPGADSPAAVRLADRLLDVLADVYRLDGIDIHISVSIGIATTGTDRTATEILRVADVAMYAAKSAGRAQYAIFEPQMDTARQTALALEIDLREAVSGQQLELVYQPIIDFGSGAVRSVEALLRWQHPTRGLIMPDTFIPIAERSGLIVSIGAWVLEEACRQLTAWDHTLPSGTSPGTISVNVSTRQIERPGLRTTVRSALAGSGLSAERLVLEITETALVDDSTVTRRLRELHDIGVKLSIDDFGTGYSSLSRLRSCPIDVIKLDRTFVAEITDDHSHVPILRATLAMAAGLGIDVVAEGIETVEQYSYLRRLHCSQGQGFLISRPLTPQRLHDLVVDTPIIFTTTDENDRSGADEDSPIDDELASLVAAAISAGTQIERLAPDLLAQLERITGLETAYLTRVDWNVGQQQILYSRNTGELHISDGTVIDWADTLCRRALNRRQSVIDTNAKPHNAGSLQHDIVTYITVPIEDEHGNINGTLCAASTQPKTLTEPTLAAVRLLARLVGQRLQPFPL